MRRLILGALVLLAAAGTLALVAASRAPADPGLQIQTAPVDRGRIVGRVTATGSVSAMVTVQVGSQLSGRIAALHADFGSRVRKGQVIARIDPRLFKAQEEQARANLRAAAGKLAEMTARAADARRKLDRAALLLKENLMAPAEYDTLQAESSAADAAVESARGSLAQAQASAHQAQTNLALTIIASPINGIVISRTVDVGQTVAASLQAPTLFTIAEDLAKMQVHTAVSEGDVGKLQPGVPAVFTVDAYPDERFHGIIRQVRDAPQVVQNIVTYDAVIDVDNKELKLKPGMTANVTFIYADRPGVLRLPNAALRFRPSAEILERLEANLGAAAPDAAAPDAAAPDAAAPDAAARTATRVWVLREGEPVPVSVQAGVSDGLLTEVDSGELTEGDVVLTDVLDLGGSGGSSQSRTTAVRKSKRIF